LTQKEEPKIKPKIEENKLTKIEEPNIRPKNAYVKSNRHKRKFHRR
jgi:hypothetical protein